MTTKPRQPKKPFHEIIKTKARYFRQHSRQRAKKAGLENQLIDIPSSKQIEQWLLDKLDFTVPSRPVFYCTYTGNKVKLSELEIDHITPLSQGGGLGFDNLCVTSNRMNGIKGDINCKDFVKLMDALDDMTEPSKKSILTRLYSGNRRFFSK